MHRFCTILTALVFRVSFPQALELRFYEMASLPLIHDPEEIVQNLCICHKTTLHFGTLGNRRNLGSQDKRVGRTKGPGQTVLVLFSQGSQDAFPGHFMQEGFSLCPIARVTGVPLGIMWDRQKSNRLENSTKGPSLCAPPLCYTISVMRVSSSITA